MKTKKDKIQTTKIYTLRLPLDLHSKLEQEANALNITISAYLRMTLTNLFKAK